MANYSSSRPRCHNGREAGRPPNSFDRRDMGLMWLPLIIPSGCAVRMKYRDVHYHAVVAYGGILDDGLIYSPNGWASKVADRTNRDAWRDLEFSKPGSSHWESAEEMRAQYRAKVKAAAKRGEIRI